MDNSNNFRIIELKDKIKSLRETINTLVNSSPKFLEFDLKKENRKNLIPRFPKKLPGSFWGITTFFNPVGYKNKIQNYKEFRISSKKQGLKLVCVELAYDRRPFELSKDDADILIQIRAESEKSIMWQKERLLNIGLKNLPKDCDKIAWLDCDIIFDNDNWIEETSKLLEEYVVVQPFSFVVRMPKGGISKNIYSLDFGDKENKKMYGMGYGINNFGKSVINDFLKHGHTGFAWTARKEIFNEINIYDKLMLGSGDLFMAQSFYGNKKNHVYDLSSNMMQLDQGEWLKFIYEVVNESVYYTPGFIFHLWHGDKSNRLHDERFEILRKYDFDPNRDIKLGMSGIWEWVTDKPELHSKVKDYFYKRVEE